MMFIDDASPVMQYMTVFTCLDVFRLNRQDKTVCFVFLFNTMYTRKTKFKYMAMCEMILINRSTYWYDEN